MPCYPEVLQKMKHQMFSHASVEYKKLHEETTGKLRRFLETENQVFLIPSSGSGFMEASVRNCVQKKMLVCINGTFGERYAEVGESNGKTVEKLEVEYGKPIIPELLHEKLSSCPDVEAVAIIHNETSTGLLNPLPKLAEVVNEHGKLLLVDAVSSMGGVEIKVDKWGIDVCFASSQKCFGVPPGLAMGSVSKGALKKSEKMKNKGWYFDFKLYQKFLKGWRTHMTPPISLVLGFNVALNIIEKEGQGNHFRLYLERSRRIRDGVKKLGVSLFPENGYESPTVTCMRPLGKMDVDEIYKQMRWKGFELAKGYGEKLKDTTWRIGNMGYIQMEDIDSMIYALGKVLHAHNFQKDELNVAAFTDLRVAPTY